MGARDTGRATPRARWILKRPATPMNCQPLARRPSSGRSRDTMTHKKKTHRKDKLDKAQPAMPQAEDFLTAFMRLYQNCLGGQINLSSRLVHLPFAPRPQQPSDKTIQSFTTICKSRLATTIVGAARSKTELRVEPMCNHASCLHLCPPEDLPQTQERPRNGCCVLQGCIDHASGHQKGQLVQYIILSRIPSPTTSSSTFSTSASPRSPILWLGSSPFGNYVVQHTQFKKQHPFDGASRLAGCWRPWLQRGHQKSFRGAGTRQQPAL